MVETRIHQKSYRYISSRIRSIQWCSWPLGWLYVPSFRSLYNHNGGKLTPWKCFWTLTFTTPNAKVSPKWPPESSWQQGSTKSFTSTKMRHLQRVFHWWLSFKGFNLFLNVHKHIYLQLKGAWRSFRNSFFQKQSQANNDNNNNIVLPIPLLSKTIKIDSPFFKRNRKQQANVKRK